MCRGYEAKCKTPSCRQPADCRWDPFCKICRAYWYDNDDNRQAWPPAASSEDFK